ncbi:hypothetical protein N0V90_002465 [Kalmusia sp. IMI 367209]|nr:hypothetical protein N0V90_002465 [Kalmusia sp. IMI 367209]
MLIGPAIGVTSNFIFDNKITGEFEYVREISPYVDATSDPELLISYPNYDPDSTDLICGRNASLGWSQTKVATVKAGDSVGFFVGRGISTPKAMYHPNFASAWLSKVEDGNLDAYKGDGDWYKIHQTAGRTSQSLDFNDPANKPRYDAMKALWGTYGVTSVSSSFFSLSRILFCLVDLSRTNDVQTQWNFTIPATTPPGKYLVRWESIFPNVQDAQFYVNCAHVEIVNAGDAVQPGEAYKVKIPGLYIRGQKDVYFSSYDYGLKGSLDGFVPPKPEVWQG